MFGVHGDLIGEIDVSPFGVWKIYETSDGAFYARPKLRMFWDIYPKEDSIEALTEEIRRQAAKIVIAEEVGLKGELSDEDLTSLVENLYPLRNALEGLSMAINSYAEAKKDNSNSTDQILKLVFAEAINVRICAHQYLSNNTLRVVNRERERIKEEVTKKASMKGYDEGHMEGYDEGHEEGHGEGYKEGHEEGRTEGYAQGRTEGYAQGYGVGYADAEKEKDRSE